MAKLGELGKIITGNTPKTSDAQNYESNDICFVKPSDFTDNEITEIHQSKFYISAYAKDKARVLPTDGILVTCIGIIGKVAINKVPCAFNQQINAIIPERKICDPRYVAYAIQNVQPQMQNTANAAVVPILNKTRFSNIEIPLPSLETQKQIVEFLDKVTSLISLRKQQLAKLDELVKARFVEMFGDFEVNPKEFPVYHLCELCDVGSSKRIYQEEQSISGIPFLKVADLNELIDTGKYLCSTFIPLERYEQLLHKELTPKENDILITSRGTLGKCYIVQSDDEFYFQDGMISWLSNLSPKVSSIYISYLFAQPYIQKQIESLQAGSTVAYLSIAMLKKMNVILPPKKLQDDFATFVEHVDQQKQTVQQSLEKLELMKKALMQEYFG